MIDIPKHEITEIIHINPENFPVGTRILSCYRHTHRVEEFQCLEWSPAGRCKILDVRENIWWWSTRELLMTIEETLPSLGFTFPYDVSTLKRD
jgi:hypothetical protein